MQGALPALVQGSAKVCKGLSCSRIVSGGWPRSSHNSGTHKFSNLSFSSNFLARASASDWVSVMSAHCTALCFASLSQCSAKFLLQAHQSSQCFPGIPYSHGGPQASDTQATPRHTVVASRPGISSGTPLSQAAFPQFPAWLTKLLLTSFLGASR